MNEESPEPSLGQALVGLTFNPSGHKTVTELKTLFAKAIDILSQIEVESDIHNAIRDNAINKAISAQMWAVKAITWKD